jgi:hypothetical protein
MPQQDNQSYAPVKDQRIHFRYPISYLEAKQAVKELHRYMDLVTLHKTGKIPDGILDPAPPIHSLIEQYDEKFKNQLLIQELSKLKPLVERRMDLAGISGKHTREVDGEEQPINIINDYFQISGSEQSKLYNSIRVTVYKTIGIYERIAHQRKVDMINPVHWIARFINLPVNAMRRAGVNVETEKTNKMHYWVLQVLMGILLTVIIIKLGDTAIFVTLIRNLL